MKKLVGVLSGIIVLSIGVNAILINEMSESKNPIQVEEVHGYKVIDSDKKENKTTILAVITNNDLNNDGNPDEYVDAINMYDKDDLVEIENKNYDIGDIITITFQGDLVDEVKEQKLALNL